MSTRCREGPLRSACARGPDSGRVELDATRGLDANGRRPGVGVKRPTSRTALGPAPASRRLTPQGSGAVKCASLSVPLALALASVAAAQIQLESFDPVHTGDDPKNVAAADLDGDGHLDVAVLGPDTNDLWVFHTLGNAHLVQIACIQLGAGPKQLETNGPDGDGGLDFVAINELSSSLSIVINDGSGFFSARPESPIDITPKGRSAASPSPAACCASATSPLRSTTATRSRWCTTSAKRLRRQGGALHAGQLAPRGARRARLRQRRARGRGGVPQRRHEPSRRALLS